MPAKRGLGRGLGALIEDYNPTPDDNGDVSEKVYLLDIASIKPNVNQPRKDFEPEKLEQLSESIKQHGVLQPILVKRDGDTYMIIAGERRFRASLKAGLKQIPAIVRELNDTELLQTALIENIQRENLNDIETAQAYRELSEKYGMTQEEIAKGVGKSRVAVANTMRLLTLSDELKKYVATGKLSAGHARAVLSLENENNRKAFADDIVKNDMSVREAELAAKKYIPSGEKKVKPQKQSDKTKQPYLKAFEDELAEALGTKVIINDGTVEIQYYTNEDLERIIEVIKGGSSSL